MQRYTLSNRKTSEKKRKGEVTRTGAGARKGQQLNDFGLGVPTVVLEQKYEKQRAGSGCNIDGR